MIFPTSTAIGGRTCLVDAVCAFWDRKVAICLCHICAFGGYMIQIEMVYDDLVPMNHVTSQRHF